MPGAIFPAGADGGLDSEPLPRALGQGLAHQALHAVGQGHGHAPAPGRAVWVAQYTVLMGEAVHDRVIAEPAQWLGLPAR